MSGNPTSDIAAARRFARDVELILNESRIFGSDRGKLRSVDAHPNTCSADGAIPSLGSDDASVAATGGDDGLAPVSPPHLVPNAEFATVTFRTSPSRAGEPT